MDVQARYLFPIFFCPVFLFILTVPRAANTSTGRDIVTHLAKSINVTGFQHDRQCKR